MTRLLGVLLMVLRSTRSCWRRAKTRTMNTQGDIADRLGFYGVLTVGVAVLIISGGIDLSIGSVVGLGAVCYGLLLQRHVDPWLAAFLVIAGSSVIGLTHGLLVTKLGLQPFLVTLCGLFIYRGLARWASPTSVGLGVVADPAYLEEIEQIRRFLVKGTLFGVPHVLILLVIVSVLLALFLHGTGRYGRYLYAIGENEEAARYAGIATDRYKIIAYIICSTLAGLGSVLYILDNRTATPTSAGSWLELYAPLREPCWGGAACAAARGRSWSISGRGGVATVADAVQLWRR